MDSREDLEILRDCLKANRKRLKDLTIDLINGHKSARSPSILAPLTVNRPAKRILKHIYDGVFTPQFPTLVHLSLSNVSFESFPREMLHALNYDKLRSLKLRMTWSNFGSCSHTIVGAYPEHPHGYSYYTIKLPFEDAPEFALIIEQILDCFKSKQDFKMELGYSLKLLTDHSLGYVLEAVKKTRRFWAIESSVENKFKAHLYPGQVLGKRKDQRSLPYDPNRAKRRPVPVDSSIYEASEESKL